MGPDTITSHDIGVQRVESTRALVLYAPRTLRLETRELPPLARGEVKVAIRATGLCGSDIHYYTHNRNGAYIMRAPLCLGHESVGEVIELGPGGSMELKIGDRVALEVGRACHDCVCCSLGRFNLCLGMKFASSAASFPHVDGTLMDYINHPEALCYKLPSHVSDIQGALIEPLAVCVQAINRSARGNSITESPSGDLDLPILIFGAGPVGLLLAVCLSSLYPEATILVADIDQARAKMVDTLHRPTIKSFWLDTQSLPSGTKSTESEDQVARAMATQLNADADRGFSRVYECTGAPACVRAGIYASTPGGVVVLIGMGGPPLPSIPLSYAAEREIDLLGVRRYNAGCYATAVEWLGSGKLAGVEKLVTHTTIMGEEGGKKAFELAAAKEDEDGNPVMKVVILNDEVKK